MTSRPILFSGSMVRAILDGRKTQTRRAVKPQPEFTGASGDSFEWHGGKVLQKAGYGAPYIHSTWTAVENAMLRVSPFQVGMSLWVRETWMEFGTSPGRVGIGYKATNDVRPDGISAEEFGACQWFNASEELYFKFKKEIERMEVEGDRWHPSIFMPRWASRITLQVVSVRVERLQDISPFDALAEGINPKTDPHPTEHCDGNMPEICCYRALWESINGKTHPWANNPWVWVITFKRIQP